MGGSAMGPMSNLERYIVTLTFAGPRKKSDSHPPQEFNKELNGLLKKYKGRIVDQMTGFKKQRGKRRGGGG